MPRPRKHKSACHGCPGCSVTAGNKRKPEAEGNILPPKKTRKDENNENAPVEVSPVVSPSVVPVAASLDPPLSRTIFNPINLTISKLNFKDLGLDEKKQTVADIILGSQSTRDSFLIAASRFEAFLKWRANAKPGNPVIDETLLIEFVDEFLLNLCNGGVPILGLGSFWPTVSHVKRYILLRYLIDLSVSKQLNRHLKMRTKMHKPKKRATFTFAELEDYVLNTAHENICDLQDKIIAIFSFYLLGRSDEISKMRKEMITFVDIENGVISVALPRCAKNPVVTHAMVHSIGSFNISAAYQLLMSSTPTSGRLWWQASNSREKLVGQPMGKRNISKVAKKIALYLGKNVENFGSHSFRRSGATSLANAGATYEEIMVAGGWSSVITVRRYIDDSESAAQRRAELLSFKWTPTRTVAAARNPPPVEVGTENTVVPQATFSNCSFSGVTFTKDFLMSDSK